MKKLLAAAAVSAVLCVLSGCSSILESERLVISEYEGDGTVESEISGVEIRDYAGLREAIQRIVEAHQEHAELTFSSYESDVFEDLSRACEEVKTKTAVGAYSVDNMFYVPTRIVSYYKADLNITYKKSRDAVDAVVQASGVDEFRREILGALENGAGLLAVRISSGLVDADTVRGYIEEAYYGNPMASVILPRSEVSAYPESGMDRIFEIELEYGYEADELRSMSQELSEYMRAFLLLIEDGEPLQRALDACTNLASGCAYTTDGGALASTAYGAAADREADGEGFALLYKALCDEMGIECTVILGRLDKEPHAWNIVKYEGQYYHVDVSSCETQGVAAIFLRRDSDMLGRYSWDFDEYPACDGPLTYYDVISEPADNDTAALFQA